MPKNKATNKDKDFDTDRYCTPEAALRPVYRFWPGGIALDPCADEGGIVRARTWLNIRAESIDGDVENGLDDDWIPICDLLELPETFDGPVPVGQRTVFINPPYSSPAPFVRKAVDFTSCNPACETILLLPPSFDAEWWEDNVWAHAAALCFVRSRFRFLKRGKPDTSPRGNSVYVLHASRDVRTAAIRRFVAAFGSVGQVMTNLDGWGN